jgi:hypothetical protein
MASCQLFNSPRPQYHCVEAYQVVERPIKADSQVQEGDYYLHNVIIQRL